MNIYKIIFTHSILGKTRMFTLELSDIKSATMFADENVRKNENYEIIEILNKNGKG